MSQPDPKILAGLAIAVAALGLSLYAVTRSPSSSACVDDDARAQVAALRGTIAERDRQIAVLTRTARVPVGFRPSGVGPVVGAAGPLADAPAAPPPPLDPGPRRYQRFEIANPAVTVTQRADATYDIRTSDPALAGTTIKVVAITEAGEQDELLVRIPE